MGQTEAGETWNWVCPHNFGGIFAGVPGVVTSVYEIQFDEERSIISIYCLTGDKSRYYFKFINQSNITYLLATLS